MSEPSSDLYWSAAREVLAETRTHLQCLRSFASTSSMTTATAPLQELRRHLSALDGAQFHCALAYAMLSLFHVHLRLKGVDPKTHAIQQELHRVKQYIGKVTSAVAAAQEVKSEAVNPPSFVVSGANSSAAQHASGARKRKERESSSSSSFSTNNKASKHSKRSKNQ